MGIPCFGIRLTLLSGLCLSLWAVPSCMKDKPEALPEILEWNPQLALPLGKETFGMNSKSGFDTTLLEVDSISGQPLWTDQYEVIMQGILDLDPGTVSENLDKLNRILFRLNFSNQFPQTIYSQAYFRDGSGAFMDSLFKDGPVETPPAIPESPGEALDPGRAQHDALVEGERIFILAQAQSILLRSSFLTGDADTSLIQDYPAFQLQIDSGIMLDLSFRD